MREPYKKGVASHLGPESCVVSRKAGHEALTGVQAGRAIEPRNGAYFRGPTLSSNAEGEMMGVVKRETAITLRGRRPRTCLETQCARTGRPQRRPLRENSGPEGERDER